MMKAIRYYQYGSPEVLRLEDVGMPAVGDQDVLIRVMAASVNPLDWHFMRGTPYILRPQAGLLRPRANGLGADMAGQVEAVGKRVTAFTPGDEVFGSLAGLGTLAEYVTVRHDAVVAPKPANQTFEQAASVPLAAFTALQSLRDQGRIQPGHKVLVNGAAGGVGTFTVQIARALGAEVTGVCSTRNTDMVASIGASQVIDYTRQDFTRTGQRYDLLVDIAGNRPFSACRRVLAPHGILVGVGGPDRGRWIGPMTRAIKALMLSPFVSQKVAFFLAKPSRDDLAVLHDLLLTGKVTPVIDRSYPLSQAPEAIRYLEQGHAQGKVVITVLAPARPQSFARGPCLHAGAAASLALAVSLPRRQSWNTEPSHWKPCEVLEAGGFTSTHAAPTLWKCGGYFEVWARRWAGSGRSLGGCARTPG
jgi:NADPH:quinone reductase-like Zn-dependent oxidoreductase